MKPHYQDKYGRGVDQPIDAINAIAYDITEGGDLVRGKPHTWTALISHVRYHATLVRGLEHLTEAQISKRLAIWLEHNETMGRGEQWPGQSRGVSAMAGDDHEEGAA